MHRRFSFPLVVVIAVVILTTCTLAGALAAAQATSARPSRELAPSTVVVNLPMGQKQAPLEMTLQQLMHTFNVPGLSVAVIEKHKIAWAKGFGVTEPGGRAPVTVKTLFQAGSISKPAAAAGALWLVEQGKLSLDEDVNQKLKTWKVPENEFTAAQKVTLRRLVDPTP